MPFKNIDYNLIRNGLHEFMKLKVRELERALETENHIRFRMAYNGWKGAFRAADQHIDVRPYRRQVISLEKMHSGKLERIRQGEQKW